MYQRGDLSDNSDHDTNEDWTQKHQSYAVIGFLVKALLSSFIERYCTKTFPCQANMKLRRDVKFTVLSP